MHQALKHEDIRHLELDQLLERMHGYEALMTPERAMRLSLLDNLTLLANHDVVCKVVIEKMADKINALQGVTMPDEVFCTVCGGKINGVAIGSVVTGWHHTECQPKRR